MEMAEVQSHPICLVTGASSGIGKSICETLASGHARVIGAGRNSAVLSELRSRFNDSFSDRVVDLTEDARVDNLIRGIEADFGRLDVLVLCAGIMRLGKVMTTPTSDLDAMYRSNLRAPYVLIQKALPLLVKTKGILVVINSSLGMATRPEAASYAAMQHALKGLTDTVRQEVNELGVRVLSVFPGRTATPRIEALFAREGRRYEPDLLLQPADIAAVVAHAISTPPRAELTDIAIRPSAKSY